MDQRTQFIADHLRDSLSIAELCELYGVSRKTGYKWIAPYLPHGPAGLEERARHPRRPAPAPARGREEAARAAAQAPSPMGAPRPFHGVPHLEPAWDGPHSTPAPPPGASRQAGRQ